MKILGIDTETTKKPNHFPWRSGFQLCMISCSDYRGKKHTFWFFHSDLIAPNTNATLVKLQRLIDQHDMVAAHNMKFDLNVLRNHLRFPKLWCTMVGEYLLNYHSNSGLSLAKVAPRYGLSDKLDKVKTMWDAGFETYEIPMSLLQEYCEDDAEKARKIAEMQYTRMHAAGLMKTMRLQMEWLDILSEMECNGVLWDMEYAKELVRKYDKYLNIIDKAIDKFIKPYCEGHDINLSSNDELSALLYGGTIIRREKVPVLKTKNIKVRMPYVFTYKDGRKVIKVKWNDHKDTSVIRMVFRDVPYDLKGIGFKPLPKSEVKKSTEERPYYAIDKSTLSQLTIHTRYQSVIIQLLLKRSAIYKVRTTFANDITKTGLIHKVTNDGKLHTNYNQTVTATGRLSSSDPNSQNLPRGNTSPIKRCIIPTLDGIMNADLSQIEWRVPAQLSQDKTMISEINSGVDQHIAACVDLMGLPFVSKADPASKKNRDHAKTFNFRMIYGGTEYGFFKDPNMPRFKLRKWGNIIKSFFKKYSGLYNWQQRNIKTVIQGDGTLVLPTGRRFKFRPTGWGGKYNEREIKNYPVQGMAGGDILPLAAVIIRKKMRKGGFVSKMILTVHDSIVFDYKESEKKDLAKLCLNVFSNLPKYIKQYWGIDWIVNLEGECEIGENYGSQKEYIP
jgi:DNA polymerase I-like protein with 3'-5' exonuclease and polymerase domains